MNMNPRRFSANRGGGRRSNSGRGPRPARGGGRRGQQLPMLLGEPSPSLAKINTMNMAKLEEKIASLKVEQERMAAKLASLEARDPQPEDKIKAAKDLLERLAALETAAAERLAGKAERKANYEQRNR